MISRVRLQNWKAFDSLDLQLFGGTTFLVARNGTGKTSLLESIAWALLGSVSGIDADKARRGDGPCRVTLDLELPSRGPVTVTRSMTAATKARKPRSTVEFHTADGSGTGDDDWAHLITATLGAPPGLLSRLLVGSDDAIWREQDRPIGIDLTTEVSRLLRLDVLTDVQRAARSEARASERQAREAKKIDAEAIDAAQTALITAESEYEVAAERLRQVEVELAAREKRATIEQQRTEWKAGADAVRARHNEAAAGVVRIAQQEGESLPSRQLTLTMVDEMGKRLRSQWDELVQSAARGRAMATVSAEQLRLLHPGDDCPVCLRQLDASAAEKAAEGHRGEIRRLEREASVLEAQTASLGSHLEKLREFRVTLSEPLPAPLAVTDEPADPASPELASYSDQRLAELLGDLQVRCEVLRDRLGVARSEEQRLQVQNRMFEVAVRSYRRQAYATVLGDTVDAVAGDLTSRGADPLVRLIRGHWKQLPGGDSLTVSRDGTIQAARGDKTVDYHSLSGGEKAQSLLVYKVAALKALTTAPLMLLDEPLEHLDPRNRWTIGRMLTDLTSQSVLDQLLVTTYEESLARRLALHGDRESVRVLPIDAA
ncbi:AAA family ATPase [Kribbella sp. NPDC059898]|uniref:AAA family ATPase n=1 Tax=Kribbella sp. NPDC059898 TaxID=3346995 RepID=UPI003666E72C